MYRKCDEETDLIQFEPKTYSVFNNRVGD